MKKSIIFMIINMNVGGTEKALLNMIAEIPKGKYDITILMLEKYGEFLNSIPSEVHVKYLEGYENIKEILNEPPHIISLEFLKKGKIIKAFNIVFLHLLSKFMKDRSIFFKYVLRDCGVIDNKYDVAIAYAGPLDFISYFVGNKIKATKKIQWIHFDITKIGFNQKFATKIYDKFHQIFVVSNEGGNKLIHTIPALKNKTDAFFNIMSPEFVVKLADEDIGFEDDFSGIRILTVGRLSKEKGQDLTIPVLAKLKGDGYNVRWYCIGEGSARIEYEKLIKEYYVQNDYLLLGANPNPYPFMKQCDIYIQPSRHEGYCITLAEARCFDNPIISTDFTGAREQIIHEQTGLIVNFDEQQMYNALRELLDNKKLRNRIRKNLQNEIVDTTKEMRKFYKIIDDIS